MNTHKKLIEEKVAELNEFDFYTDGGNIGADEVEPWLRKALQDTIDTVSMIVREEEAVEYNKIIDTVLEGERERVLKCLTTPLETKEMLEGWERYWEKVEEDKYVENCIECENTKRILEGLTPLN